MEDVAGQAVLNGVLMRSPDKAAIAIRSADGIQVKNLTYTSWLSTRAGKVPILRGFLLFIETIYLAFTALYIGAEEDLSPTMVIATLVASLLFVLFIFKFIPYVVAEQSTSNSTILILVEGGAKITLFVAYLWLVASMEEIQQMWRYHGAEHKALHAYQSNEDVTVESAGNHPKEHPGCGTNFLLYVLILSIGVYWLIPSSFNTTTQLSLRIAALPLIAGLSYEGMRSVQWSPALQPGKWIQQLTTKEPGEEELAVAVAALEQVIDDQEPE